MIEKLKNKIINFFKIDNSYAVSIVSFILVFTICLLAYNLLIVFGYTNPDGIMEGYTFYNNAYVASAMSGRWFVRYLEKLMGSVVSPFVDVLFYAFCCWLSSLFIRKVWKMDNVAFYIMCAFMASSPATIAQMGYLYMTPAYSACCLFCSIFLYINFEYTINYGIISSAFIALSLGLYQSYIGMAAVLVLATLIIRLIRSYDIKQLAKKGIQCLLYAIIGGVFYLIGLKIDLSIYGLDSNNRIESFNIKSIFSNLSSSIVETYKTYINYYSDYIMHRKLLFLVLFIIFFISLIIVLIKLIKQKKVVNVILVIIFVLLIPPFSNIIGILIPSSPVRLIMTYQTLFVIPLGLVFIKEIQINNLLFDLVKTFVILLCSLICWTYVISANATYRSYQLSYQHINNQMGMILNDIYHTEGYKKDETKIMLCGFVDDDYLRKTREVYRYSIDLNGNVAFWEDMNGVTYGRENYFTDFFGINAGYVFQDDYYWVIYSDEFNQMEIWPNKNSIRMFGDYIVVKLSNEPIR